MELRRPRQSRQPPREGDPVMAVVAATAGAQAPARDGSWLERTFALQAQGVTVGNEVRAGLTTFMVMAYIIFVNPAILSFAGIAPLEGKGPPFLAVVAATCLVAAVTSIAMGIFANYPLAMAP